MVFLSNVLLVFILVTRCLSEELGVGRSSFKLYRQGQNTTQKNHIKLEFKTIHATGLIMLARGPSKKDFFSVELYRGKIRVAGNFANGTANALRPVQGHYDMYAGKDLADNKWHTVEVIRNIRQTIIFIDKGRGNMEKKAFSKSPATYTELSVSMVAFGGYFSFSAGDISSRISLSRKGFRGCFREALFSQEWWPEAELSWRPEPFEVDFLQSATSDPKAIGMTLYGEMKDVCETYEPSYAPMFFSSLPVHLALIQNYTIQKWKMELKFRTVINEQTLANYTTIAGITKGEQIQLDIDRKGRLVLRIIQGEKKQFITTSKIGFHDSEWHTVMFNLDNVETADGDYIIEFSVDGKTRLTRSRKLYFDGFINVGFGFTGCMRDIKINDEDIRYVRKDPEVAKDFFQIADVGVMYNSCELKDHCNPNPCQNGGSCNQTEDNVVCNCKGTLYDGSTCHRPRFNYTCAGVRKSGERRSDVYYIDMDGMGPIKPVRVLCDLGKTIETTVTQINNTKYEDIDVTTKTKINEVDVNYQASITQMRELIMNSNMCEQYIKYTCKGTPLFLSPAGPPQTSWMGGDDVVHYYWGGAKGRRGYCACGVRGDCQVAGVLIGKYCNCDSLNDRQQIFDEGNFTIKAHLPVRQVQFKSVLKNSVEALLRVGHLRCSGFGSHDIAATFRKRYSYLSVYHPDQPFDNIQAGGISFDFKTSVAYNFMIMAHAIGPFSGNYIKIMVWSRTMVRVHLNLGFGDLKQDVDISSTGRTLDDNEWHELEVMFNLKELNVTLNGIEMIQGIPLQEVPVVFNVDATPVYVGGSAHSRYGFIGCIRSLYVNGRIFDIKTIAEGQEDFGVYPGCGSACMLLNRPCNYGQCFDKYDSFSCNCTVSPYDGQFCQNETYPKSFGGGNYIAYDFTKANQSKPLATGLLVLGIKTGVENAALAQIIGVADVVEENTDNTDNTKDTDRTDNLDRHYTLALVNGYLTLYWNLKSKKDFKEGTAKEVKTEILQINTRKLNDNRHHVVKLEVSSRELWLHVPDYNLTGGVNVTESKVYNEDKSAVLRYEGDQIRELKSIRIGNVQNIKMGTIPIPTDYTGCMSGAKFVFTPHATLTERFPDAIEIDFFKMISVTEEDNKEAADADEYPWITGSFPNNVEDGCGPSLKTPGELPTVGPEKQFFTKSPGLDLSVRIPESSWLNQLMIVVVVLVVAVVLLGFSYFIYKKVNVTMHSYNHIRKEEYPKNNTYKQEKPRPVLSQTQPAAAPEKSVEQQDPNKGATELESFDRTEDTAMFL